MQAQIDDVDRLIDRLLAWRKGRDAQAAQQAAWASLQAAMDRLETSAPRRVSTRGQAWQWMAPLMAMSILAVAGIWWRYETHQRSPERPAIYTTRPGQRAVITLRDGSRVMLGTATVLRVEPRFGEATRVVHLTGEAYFTVTPSLNAPFIVQTGRITTRVLGTTFTVRRYHEDADVQVAVINGKVALATPHRSPVIVTAGMVGRATDSATTVVAEDISPYTGWTEGRLVFRNAPLPAVLTTVGRWYDLEFRLADSTLAQRHVTTALDYASTADLLSAVETLLDVSATFERHPGGRAIVTLAPHRHARTPVYRGEPLSLPHALEVGK